MEFLTAEQAIKDIAPFVGLDATNDQQKLFLYLTMAQKKAWKNGSYKGFLKECDLCTYEANGHRYVKTPHGYNVLMGINLNTKPVEIKDSYFQFHHNASGSLTSQRRLAFTNFTLNYRECATLLGQPITGNKMAFKVGALARSAETVETIISGLDVKGFPIYTYEDDGIQVSPEQQHGASSRTTLNGATIKLNSNKLRLIDNLWWQEITAIQKPQTNGPIDYYANYSDGTTVQIARIEPHQTRSMYRIYEVPAACGNNPSIHALMKISEPDPIVNLRQRLIIDDIESLMSLMIGMDQAFDKRDIQLSEAFMAKGILGLDQESQAGKSPTAMPIQYLGLEDDMMDECYYRSW